MTVIPVPMVSARVVRARAAHRLGMSGPRARRQRPARTLGATLDAIAAEVRAGSSTRDALVRVAADEGRTSSLMATADAIERGASLASALERWRAPAGAELAAAAIRLAHETGGSVLSAVDGVAATVHERAAIAAEAQVQSAQARASALVVGICPVAFLAVVSLTDPDVPAFLVGHPVGWICVAGGLLLEAVGLAWMRHLVRRVQ
jgi:tight adherence protein B